MSLIKPEYKYTTKFESVITATNEFEKDLNISKANLEDIRYLVPTQVDLDRNIDLLGVAFDVAVVNKFNGNGDGISSAVAEEIFPYFNHKPTNIEHETNNIVGHIVGSHLTTIDGHEPLSQEGLEGLTSPFYLTLSSVVYKTVNPEFSKFLLEASDEESEFYRTMSASWELGYNNYSIAVTNGSDLLQDAILVSDSKEIERLSQYLKAFGGPGRTPDGSLVFRLIEGPVFPLGIGFTSNPAADVSGVLAGENNSLVIKTSKRFMQTNSTEKDSLEISDIKISQNGNNAVKKENNILDMDSKDIEKIVEDRLAALTLDKSVASSISSVISDTLRDKEAEFKLDREEIESKKVQAELDVKEAKASIEDFKTQLSAAQTQITELTTSIEVAQAADLFNSRMAKVDELYSLEASDLSIVAPEVKDLDKSEASFEGYLNKLEVCFKHRSKAFQAEQETKKSEEIDRLVQVKLDELEKSSASSTEEATVETAVENAVATEESEVTNGSEESSSTQETTIERLTKNFKKENIKVQY